MMARLAGLSIRGFFPDQRASDGAMVVAWNAAPTFAHRDAYPRVKGRPIPAHEARWDARPADLSAHNHAGDSDEAKQIA
jgi:hypothetical protein